MCYTKESSIIAFFVGIISSFLLYIYGNPTYKQENLVISSLFIFVSFMQIFDFMMYIDPKCTSGWNKLAGYLGPLFNSFQPIILFIFIQKFYTQDPTSFNSLQIKIIYLLNYLYIIFILYLYFNYLKKNQLCSNVVDGRISWAWYNHGFDKLWSSFYYLVTIMNILVLINYKYIFLSSLIGFIFLAISYLKYQPHVGEFWCWFVNSIPLIILFFQKYI